MMHGFMNVIEANENLLSRNLYLYGLILSKYCQITLFEELI